MVSEKLGSVETRTGVVTRVSTNLKWMGLESDRRSGRKACGRGGASSVDESSWTGGSCDPSS